MNITHIRTNTITRLSTDIGEFRVWDHGAVDYWSDVMDDWTCLPDRITAEEETEIRNAGFKLMGK